MQAGGLYRRLASYQFREPGEAEENLIS
jgi:hypothetical protein